MHSTWAPQLVHVYDLLDETKVHGGNVWLFYSSATVQQAPSCSRTEGRFFSGILEVASPGASSSRSIARPACSTYSLSTGGCTTCKHANKLFNTKMCSLNVCMCAIMNLTSSLSITTTRTSTSYKNLLCTGVPGDTTYVCKCQIVFICINYLDSKDSKLNTTPFAHSSMTNIVFVVV